MSALLDIRDLSVRFSTDAGPVYAVDRVSLDLHPGEVLAVVGESGCGKSVLALSILGLIAPPGEILGGQVLLDGTDLRQLPPARLQAVRGKDIGMVFQEPTMALHPVLTVGRQIGDVLRRHEGLGRKAARLLAIELLAQVGIPDPDRRIDEYPHQLSGGMAQRVMIAMAIACHPRLLIADEPTTALDVTIQAGVLQLLLDLRRRLGMAILLITHDLGVVADVADRVMVMYAGRRVETARVETLFASPAHPYTLRLLGAVRQPGQMRQVGQRVRLPEIPGLVPTRQALADCCLFAPRCTRADARCRRELPALAPQGAQHLAACHHPGPEREAAPQLLPIADRKLPEEEPRQPVLEVSGLRKHFPIPSGLFTTRGVVHAVEDVSFTLHPRENLALVGESGSGKSTVGKCVLQLLEPSAGQIHLQGVVLDGLSRHGLRPLRRRMQIIFQDPYSSLNPRMTVGQIIAWPLVHHGLAAGRELEARVAEMLAQVGLRPEIRDRYPHQLAGGQRQRVAIARALIVQPSLLVADEPLSALDASVQAATTNLLLDLQAKLDFSCLFITHDLSAAEYLCDRIAVMYLGRIVELAPREAVLASPKHPYTQALLSAVPVPDPVRQRSRRRIVLDGALPSPIDPPTGCPFHTRCPVAEPRCRRERPPLVDVTGSGHWASCHLIGPDGRAPAVTTRLDARRSAGESQRTSAH